MKACWEAVLEKVSAVCAAAEPTSQTAAPIKTKLFIQTKPFNVINVAVAASAGLEDGLT